MINQYGQWYPDYPGQNPYTDPAYIRSMLQGQQQAAQPSPVQPAPQPQTSVAMPVNPKIWVKSDRDALEYHVQANGAADLWNDNAPYVYLKTADASGRQNTRKYRLTEEPIGESPGSSEPSRPAGMDLSSFAAKSDLSEIASIVSGLSKDMDALRDEVENLSRQTGKRMTGAKAKKETGDDE